MDSLLSITNENNISQKELNHVKSKLEQAYKLCKDNKPNDNIGFTNCPIKDTEFMEIAQSTLSVNDLRLCECTKTYS